MMDLRERNQWILKTFGKKEDGAFYNVCVRLLPPELKDQS